ncbi:hypothetical protein ABO04_08115 [Nitrosomonas sp. HPC101]|nr:hypothetical protein [Nitrosomonas sp. HPC101]
MPIGQGMLQNLECSIRIFQCADYLHKLAGWECDKLSHQRIPESYGYGWLADRVGRISLSDQELKIPTCCNFIAAGVSSRGVDLPGTYPLLDACNKHHAFSFDAIKRRCNCKQALHSKWSM